jgi:16S rRNA (cytosine967-C5)-methyltransferase
MNARGQAARLLAQVVNEGHSLTDALEHHLPGVDVQQRPLVQELAYGSLRWYYRLAVVLERLLKKPFKRRDADLYCLLLSGIYQLEHTGVPSHVAVNETVQACRELGKDWAAGLVNAVLRNYQRRTVELAGTIESSLPARYAHPEWMIRRLQADWPQDWESILHAGNQRPPFSLRVNRLQLDRAAYLQRLEQRGIRAREYPHTTQGVLPAAPMPVTALPGFAEGMVSVQDGAAQQAAELLDLRSGQQVLDACAAPGGKTAHILESEPGLAGLTAVDIDAHRAALIRDNLDRLGLAARVRTADVSVRESWWDGQPFDRILLDAPCSASGVIRRHPDIKLLRRQADISGLVERQAQLLAAVWPLLTAGGMLLYSTCSVFAAENEQQVGHFLAVCPEAADVTPEVPWGRVVTHGRQVLPGEDDMDGFYYACLRKVE